MTDQPPSSTPSPDAALAHADAGLDASLERLFALLRIPSISTDPAYAAACQGAAQWLSDELAGQGFTASVRATAGHPMVLAHDLSADGPHVLFYGHYDVQPVDPLSLWSSDPFDPQLVEGRAGRQIVARGASDDKGQLMTFIEACRALRAANGRLPVKVTILLEGEEEAGSSSLPAFLEATADELKADIALVCDTDRWDADTPAITTRLRGLVGEEVEISCASQDLHSGMFGGPARNPLQVLAEIIASLRTKDGGVALPGFYDGVGEPVQEVKDQWARLPFDQTEFLGNVGLSIPAGEVDRSLLEQIWSRPTCEVNGMSGGYTGQGFKTVIPARASAKISFRLVGDQDPEKVRAAFRAHVDKHLPADCTARFLSHGASPALTVSTEGPFVRRAAQALRQEWGREAVLAGSGGSIPVVDEFKRRLGLYSLLIGFAQNNDRIHSPNEKYDLKSFSKGTRSWIRILTAFAQPD